MSRETNMTLEERIKEVEKISNATVTSGKIDDDLPKEFKDMLNFCKATGFWQGRIELAEQALPIIKEQQEEIEKLKEFINREVVEMSTHFNKGENK
tara:strand:+ start:931 stop:1218 length:288 start_codon:yes stop_codon:yes gene_type:complete